MQFNLKYNEIHSQIKKQHGQTITYQGVHKFLNELEKEGVVLKKDREYMLNINWLANFQNHLQNVRHSYQGEGEMLNLDFDSERTPLSIIAKYKQSITESFKNSELLELPSISKLYLTTLGHRSKHPKEYNLLQEIKKNKHLLLLGKTGSGKTVISKYLAHFFARNSSLIPIIINLQYDKIEDLSKAILERLHEHIDKDLDEDFVMPLLKEGNFVFVVDSIDNSTDSSEFLANLRRCFVDYKRNHWIILCRFDSDPKQSLQVPTFQINPFSRKQVFSIVFQKASERLYRRVKYDRTLFTLCQNPQFLTFAIEAFTDENPIINTAADLYTSYLRAILQRHAFKKSQCRFLAEPAKRILAEIAFKIKNRQTLPQWEEITQIIEKYSSGKEGELFSFIVETGILEELPHGQFQFQHAPLIEYLAALHIQQEFAKNPPGSILHQLIHKKQWLDVFSLYSSLEPENMVLQSLWQRYLDDGSRQDLLLLGKILSEAGLLGKPMYQKVLESLLTLYSLDDAKFYPLWYQLNEIFSNIHSKEEHKRILHFLERLRENPNARLTNVLFNSTVSINNKEAFSLLSDAMQKSDDPHFVYSLAEIVGLQKASQYLQLLFDELKGKDPITKAVVAWAIKQCGDEGVELLQKWDAEFDIDSYGENLFEDIEKILKESTHPIQIGHSCIELCRLNYVQGIESVYYFLDRELELTPVLKYHICYALSLHDIAAEYDVFETIWNENLLETRKLIVAIKREVEASGI